MQNSMPSLQPYIEPVPAAFKALPDAIVVMDAGWRIIFWNPAAATTWGLNETHALGKNIFHAVPALAFLEPILEDKNDYTCIIENQLEQKDRLQYLRCSWSICKEASGAVSQAVLFTSDVSDLVHFRQKAEQENHAKTSYLAQISHELRTPLLGILGFCDMLRPEDMTGRQRESAETICFCARQMLSLVNKVLDLSKLEAGGTEMYVRDFNLRGLLWQSLQSIEPGANEKGLALRFDPDPDLPDIVNGDDGKLRQILINLLSNAVKYTESGYLQMVARILQENIHSQADQLVLQITILDTGQGVYPDRVEEIFQPYKQLNQLAPGSGLGLAISKQLVQLIGGRLWYEPRPGGGSNFSFTIPLRRVNSWDSQMAEGQSDKGTLHKPILNCKVLLAEDITINRKLVQYMLEELGCQVFAVANGHECMQTLHEWIPDIVLMDMQMPVMDGYTATKLIRSSQQWRHLPIVALTAYALNTDIEKCLTAGCNRYLSKPFSKDDLYMMIKDCLFSDPPQSQLLFTY